MYLDLLGRKITANELIKRTKLIVTYIKKFQKNANDTVTNSSQNFKEANFDPDLLLTFVMMIYQWTSDIIVLNTIGKSYYEKILKLPERCEPQLVQTNYTLQGERDFFIVEKRKVLASKWNCFTRISIFFRSYSKILRYHKHH